MVLFRQNSVHDETSTVACASRKLLYSGRIISKELIASGTIQNDVEVWCAKNGTVRKWSRHFCVWKSCKFYFRPKLRGVGQGHRGSIFCIIHENGVLYTGSDDRSIRIWHVDDVINGNNVAEKHTLWGHTARIWSLTKSGKWLVSGGEDAIIIWNLETLKSVKTIPGRFQASISR